MMPNNTNILLALDVDDEENEMALAMSSLLLDAYQQIISLFVSFWRPVSAPTPRCYGMQELSDATSKRANVAAVWKSEPLLAQHLSYGLAYTTGSALGSAPPSIDVCLDAFIRPHKNTALTTGARAWSKHAPRSQSSDDPKGWWGHPAGPVSTINEQALALFWKITSAASWRNLHWLPKRVLVYEVRIEEGYGMRWSQDQSEEDGMVSRPWIFRGFVEPYMENGHEVGWRH